MKFLVPISLLIAVFLVLTAGFSGPLRAEVPPHVPGSICFTPDFWCWAEVEGVSGAPCMCSGVSGVLG